MSFTLHKSVDFHFAFFGLMSTTVSTTEEPTTTASTTKSTTVGKSLNQSFEKSCVAAGFTNC